MHVLQYLPRLARGEIVGCFGLTEPNHGSDPSRCVALGAVCCVVSCASLLCAVLCRVRRRRAPRNAC